MFSHIDWPHINWAKALAWLVLGPISLALLLYMWLLAANARDRRPSDAARVMEQILRSVPSVPDAQNGYIFVMGFDVARNGDPRALGVRRIAWARHLAAHPEEPERPTLPSDRDDFKLGRSDAVNRLSETCHNVTPQCVQALTQAGDTAHDWLESDQWLRDRYGELIAHPDWAVNVPFTTRTRLPPYRLVLDGQTAFLAKAWELAATGDAHAVRDLLNADAHFWRGVLARSEILITKMIAVSALNRHFAWANLALRRLPSHAVKDAVPQEWMIPFTDEERSLRLALAGEWAFSDHVTRDLLEQPVGPGITDPAEAGALPRIAWRLARPALQPQDSSNRLAKLMLAVLKALDAPYRNYPDVLQQVRALERDASDEHPAFSRPFNLIGDTMLAWGEGTFGNYAVRVADLEGIRRLALLTTDLRSRAVDAAQVPKALADSELRNPYTDKPFNWSEKESATVFTGLEHGERRRHAFPY